MSPPQETKTGGCPVDHKAQSNNGCPVDHNSTEINPLNNMPYLSQLPHATQTAPLSTRRSISSIPKGSVDVNDGDHGNTANGAEKEDKWVYPSPQQFYNALKRKGWNTPENQIDVMVDIHNFLNEECWGQVLNWERKYHCDCPNPTLLKFQGKPQELSPKARLFTFFGSPKPFDRHDWTISRCGRPVRYVIDYYGGDEHLAEDGNPVFYVDVRPALDGFSGFSDRIREAGSGLYKWLFGQDKNSK